MANTFRNEIYRSPVNLSYITSGLLGSLIFCGVLFIFSGFGMALYPDSAIDLGDGDTLPIAHSLIGLTALLHIPLFIATILFFLIWEHRAFNNLSALNAGNLEFSPGWAIGWWFIPLANLVKPFQAMRELWTESEPEDDADPGFSSSSASTPTIMIFWWAIWLLSNFISRIADKMDGSRYFPVAVIIAAAFEIAGAALLIKIILDIGKRQETRFQKVETSAPSAPPPPPTFA